MLPLTSRLVARAFCSAVCCRPAPVRKHVSILVPDPCGLPQRLEPHEQMKILDSTLLAVITEAKHGQQFQLSRVPAASVPTCDKFWPLQCH